MGETTLLTLDTRPTTRVGGTRVSAYAKTVRYVGMGLGGLQLLLGLLLWAGIATSLLPAHMLNGILIAVLLVLAAFIGKRAGSGTGLFALAIGLTVFLPVFGIMHVGMLPGSLHWIIQVVHLVVGIAALALIDRLSLMGVPTGRGVTRAV